MTYREFRQAIEVFDLGERATLDQIKTRHRELVKAHHPDRGSSSDPEVICRVNCAYEVLTAYCESYRYCFAEEEFLEQVPEDACAASSIGTRSGVAGVKPKRTDFRGHSPTRRFRSDH